MDFRILGPVEVTAGPKRLELGGSRQQIVLAALLLGAGRVVTTDRLVEAIYGQDLPPTARNQAQISVSLLRRLLVSHGRAAVISTRPEGYALQVGDDVVDARRFGQLVADARAARQAGRLEQAVAFYRDALRLWRGAALEGLDSALLQAAASGLDEQRIGVTEDRVAVELDLGRHHELAGEIAGLVGEFPLRERLRGQLMLALYRCGRAAEALAAYRQARQAMVEELGIEPGEELQQLQRGILTADPALAPPGGPRPGPVTVRPPTRQLPRLLPTAIADFTGRAGQVGQIRVHLAGAAGREPGLAVPVVVLSGTGGVGKTSLAVYAAHGMAARFPHGQLFADLHGGSADPAGPMQVLERFLRALGVPGPQIPEGLEERAEAYRNLLAGRRVLVVLDDAASEAQVSPLLPGSAASAVLITSRSRLAGLPGAVRVEVKVFDPEVSLELLDRIAGAGRVAAQPAAAVAVAGQCGHLPLALRIAGARLSERPHWSIQHLAERLADETRRLDELRHGEVGVRASISLSYAGASEKAQRLFRRLALLQAPVFSGWVAAPLLDQPPDEAADLLDDLISAQLVDTAGGGPGEGGQYRLHELIRVFAAERLAAEERATEQQAAMQRALGALLYLAEEAYRRVWGGDFLGRIRSDAPRWPLPGQLTRHPLSWIEHERATLTAAVWQAAQAGLAEMSWGLALIAATLFLTRAYFDDWQETSEIALEAARQSGDVRGQAAMFYSMGSLRMQLRQFDQARRELTVAARLFQFVGEDHGFALVTRNIANIDRLSGRLDDATRRYEQVLAAFRRTADSINTAWVLHELAAIKLERRQLDDAGELLAEALPLCRMAGSGTVEAVAHIRLGEARLLAGKPASAVEAFERALALVRDIGDHFTETNVLQGLGVAQVRQGELRQARSTLQLALELAGRTGARMAGARALLGLAEIAISSADPGQAAVHAQRASGAFREMGTPLDEARALTLLSEAHAALADTAAARAALARAAVLRAPHVGEAQASLQA